MNEKTVKKKRMRFFLLWAIFLLIMVLYSTAVLFHSKPMSQKEEARLILDNLRFLFENYKIRNNNRLPKNLRNGQTPDEFLKMINEECTYLTGSRFFNNENVVLLEVDPELGTYLIVVYLENGEWVKENEKGETLEPD